MKSVLKHREEIDLTLSSAFPPAVAPAMEQKPWAHIPQQWSLQAEGSSGQQQSLLARLFLVGKTRYRGRWHLHLHLVSSLVFGTTATNLNSLGREGERGPTSWKRPHSQPSQVVNWSANLCPGLFQWLSACFPFVSSNWLVRFTLVQQL